MDERHPLCRDEPRPLTETERDRWLAARETGKENEMRRLFQVTVADEDGTVVDTGWVYMSPDGLAGAALYDEVLAFGLEAGIETTKEDAMRSGDD